MKESKKNNEIVLTGQYLGVVEEYLPDKKSTFVRDGQIFATKTGIVSINKERRAIEIKSHKDKDRKIVKINDIIIGTIQFLRLYSVGISFATVNNKIHFNSSNFGNIHVSHISHKFIDKIAVIKKEQNEYSLSTKGNDLGVIHADCSICGSTLEKIGQNRLKCPRCGNTENRKLASDYGNVTENLRY